MNLERVLEILQENGHGMNSIMFRSQAMNNWYRPKSFSPSGNLLICSSPTRKDLAQWPWRKGSILKSCCRVVKVEVKENKGRKNLSTPRFSIYLTLREG